MRCVAGKYQRVAVADRQHAEPSLTDAAPTADARTIRSAQQWHHIVAVAGQGETFKHGNRGVGIGVVYGIRDQLHRRGLFTAAHVQPPFAQGAARIAIQWAAHAHQDAKPSAHRCADAAALCRRQGGEPALVEQQQIEFGQAGCIQRRRCVAKLQSAADLDAGLQRCAGIGGPALQVLQFRAGRCRQQTQRRRGDGTHAHRYRQLVEHFAFGVQHAQGEVHIACTTCTGSKAHATVLVRRRDIDAMAGRIEQFNAHILQALHAAAHFKARTRHQQRRCMQFNQSLGGRVGNETQCTRQHAVAITRRQALADDDQLARARMLAQRGGKIRHRCNVGHRCGLRQTYTRSGRHHGDLRSAGITRGDDQRASVGRMDGWIQRQVEQHRGGRLQQQHRHKAQARRTRRHAQPHAGDQQGRADDGNGQPGHHGRSCGAASASR
ncbi:hypothetical protein D3C81_687900 [compost metagenome]